MNLRPDPTFHATAALAMKAPVEKLAFTGSAQMGPSLTDWLSLMLIHLQKHMVKLCTVSLCPTKGMNFTILAGMPVLRRCRL